MKPMIFMLRVRGRRRCTPAASFLPVILIMSLLLFATINAIPIENNSTTTTLPRPTSLTDLPIHAIQHIIGTLPLDCRVRLAATTQLFNYDVLLRNSNRSVSLSTSISNFKSAYNNICDNLLGPTVHKDLFTPDLDSDQTISFTVNVTSTASMLCYYFIFDHWRFFPHVESIRVLSLWHDSITCSAADDSDLVFLKTEFAKVVGRGLGSPDSYVKSLFLEKSIVTSKETLLMYAHVLDEMSRFTRLQYLSISEPSNGLPIVHRDNSSAWKLDTSEFWRSAAKLVRKSKMRKLHFHFRSCPLSISKVLQRTLSTAVMLEELTIHALQVLQSPTVNSKRDLHVCRTFMSSIIEGIEGNNHVRSVSLVDTIIPHRLLHSSDQGESSSSQIGSSGSSSSSSSIDNMDASRGVIGASWGLLCKPNIRSITLVLNSFHAGDIQAHLGNCLQKERTAPLESVSLGLLTKSVTSQAEPFFPLNGVQDFRVASYRVISQLTQFFTKVPNSLKSLEILLPISLEHDPALPAFLDSFQWQQPTLKHLDIQWAVDISNSTSPTAAFHLLEKAFETVFQSLSKSRLKLTHLVYDVFPLSKMASRVFSEYLSRHGASIEVCQLTTPRFGDLGGTEDGDNEEEERGVKKARDEILREFLVSLVLHSPKISCYRLSWVGKQQVDSKDDD